MRKRYFPIRSCFTVDFRYAETFSGDTGYRYQGSSGWVASNGSYYWENTTDMTMDQK